MTASDKPSDKQSACLQRLVRLLHDKLVWVAPVGKYKPTGYMVCKRYLVNPDGPTSVIDYLRRDGGWKRPFRDAECEFATYEEAVMAAARSALPNDQDQTRSS